MRVFVRRQQRLWFIHLTQFEITTENVSTLTRRHASDDTQLQTHKNTPDSLSTRTLPTMTEEDPTASAGADRGSQQTLGMNTYLKALSKQKLLFRQSTQTNLNSASYLNPGCYSYVCLMDIIKISNRKPSSWKEEYWRASCHSDSWHVLVELIWQPSRSAGMRLTQITGLWQIFHRLFVISAASAITRN